MGREKQVTIKVCPVCGKDFAVYGSQLYCSDECKQKARQERKKQSEEEYKQGINRKCVYCGSDYKARAQNQRYCCSACADRAAYERKQGKNFHPCTTPPKMKGFTEVTAQIVARCMAYDKMTISEIALLLNWDKDCLKREIRVNKNLVAPWRQIFEKEREERMKYKRKMNARRKSHV